jgi:PBP1b-binding outer membrane lipoprotein LpoB
MIHSLIQRIILQNVGIQSILAILLICILLFSGCVSFSKDTQSNTTTSDFRQDLQAKTIVRELSNPIADVSTFNMIVQSVITDNPFACVGYTSDGINHDPVEKIKEVYTARILFEDTNGNIVSTHEETYNISTEYTSGVTAFLANNQLATAQGGVAIHDSKFDLYGATLKCHDVNGENYYVVFTRDDVILAAYSDESIRTRFETWANTVPSLSPVKEKTKQKSGGYLGNIPPIEPYFKFF